jgi:A/G-specific adenine glycosylase
VHDQFVFDITIRVAFTRAVTCSIFGTPLAVDCSSLTSLVLQQTRVSTVIPYFKAWISKWPTVQDLAAANHDDVLSVWKGLGYYSRATRLHQGAQAIVSQKVSGCIIPSKVAQLQHLPGIGRYTAGAISSIAFGEPEPVLDGNVARVLSRQLGLYADVKDKKTSDLLWEVADQLIKHVSMYPEVEKSAVPANWNQAMMELGSTICTPQPKCDECPIQSTCRVYAEGQKLSGKKGVDAPVLDIEDACGLCEQLDTEDLVTAPTEVDGEEAEAEKPAKKRKTQANTISNYFGSTTRANTKAKAEDTDKASSDTSQANESKKRKSAGNGITSKTTIAYCSLFPKKVPKKKPAEEECVVCIIELEQPDGETRWLIEQRPAKGNSPTKPNSIPTHTILTYAQAS